MKLIDEKELYFFGNNIFSRIIAKFVMWLFAIKQCERIYNDVYDTDPEKFTDGFFTYLNSSYHLVEKELQNIPTKGSAIVISNHPTGTYDGMVMVNALLKVRPDVKFMVNSMIDRIEPIKPYFINVNPFNSKSATNLRGMRECKEHLDQGGLLVLFPAGQISSYRKPFGHIEDRVWTPSMIKFIKNNDAPVVPVFLGGYNSTLFHLVGLIHPFLRTAMIPRETTNKKNVHFGVRIGTPISHKRVEEFANVAQLGEYLRASVYAMNEYVTSETWTNPIINEKISEVDISDISPSANTDLINKELAAIKEFELFSHGTMSVYFTTSTIIPVIMTEIGRQREITFREIGEGTGMHIDTDSYDTYYRQLFIWDHAENRLVGAYRVGMGHELMEHYGVKGFYTNSLFKISPVMGEVLEQTIELGRSFVVRDYQRKPASLLLLWKGILHILLNNHSYRFLMGPVTMTGKLSDTSKSIIINFVLKNHFDYESAKWIKPVTGLKGLNIKKFNYSKIEDIESLDLIDKLVLDTECGEFGVPILLKKYLQLNGKIMGFNIDHNFNDSIDALMLLDLNRIPEAKIMMLSKELEFDVMGRFGR